MICDLWAIPPKVQEALGRFIEHGGSVAILGAPPSTPIGNVHLVADIGDVRRRLQTFGVGFAGAGAAQSRLHGRIRARAGVVPERIAAHDRSTRAGTATRARS